MGRKRFTPEQIIGKLREAEARLFQAQTAAQVCRTLGIADQTFSCWGQKYAELRIDPRKIA